MPLCVPPRAVRSDWRELRGAGCVVTAVAVAVAVAEAVAGAVEAEAKEDDIEEATAAPPPAGGRRGGGGGVSVAGMIVWSRYNHTRIKMDVYSTD